MDANDKKDKIFELVVIKQFIAAVEQRAEAKMLLTHKLEGAHYAAMKEILTELEAGVKGA
jgi:hypothetical protein